VNILLKFGKKIDFSYKKKIGFLFRVKRNIFLLGGKHNSP